MRTAFEKGFNVVTLTDCTATTSAEGTRKGMYDEQSKRNIDMLFHHQNNQNSPKHTLGQKASTTGTYGMFSTPMTKDDFVKKL